MEVISDNGEISRRDFLKVGIVSVASAAGGVVLGRTVLHDVNLPFSEQKSPLQPENGEAQSKLNIAWLPDTVTRWKAPIEQMASKYDIDPNLIGIIMTVESGGNPNAKSNKDALGLMQITPPRAQDIAQKFISPAVPSYDLKDPMTNIEFGAANIRQLIKEYGEADQGPSWDETVQLVAAGYNGGEGAANQFKKSGLTALNQETYSYVRYVSNMWRERHDNKSFTLYYWRNIAHGEKLLKAAEKYKM